MAAWRYSSLLLLLLVWQTCSSHQFCGSDLADVMALVCHGRGYNVAFKTEMDNSERRYKRGIVDECCKRGCSWSTLETYCSAPTEIQIRKRSDFSSMWQADTTESDVKNNDMFKYDTNEMRTPQATEKQPKWKLVLENNKPAIPNNYFSIWEGLYRQAQSPHGRSIVNKVKRNDIEEDKSPIFLSKTDSKTNSITLQDFLSEYMKARIEKSIEDKEQEVNKNVPIRHHHRKSEMVKKKVKENGINTSQIGTVPPYFQGRTLVLSPSRKL